MVYSFGVDIRLPSGKHTEVEDGPYLVRWDLPIKSGEIFFKTYPLHSYIFLYFPILIPYLSHTYPILLPYLPHQTLAQAPQVMVSAASPPPEREKPPEKEKEKEKPKKRCVTSGGDEAGAFELWEIWKYPWKYHGKIHVSVYRYHVYSHVFPFG